MTAASADRRTGSRGPAPSRSLPEIVEAAVGLADRRGLTAVTMREVAAALRLAPAALYRYLASRDALVEAMVDRALEDLVLPRSPTGGAVADLVAIALAQATVLRRHPWLVDTMQDVRPGPVAIRLLDEGLRILAPSSAPGAEKLETLAMITGVAALLARGSVEPPSRTIEALVAATPTHPHLAAAFADPGSPASPDALLTRTVEALLRGLLD